MKTILANLMEEHFKAEADALAEEKARKQTIEQFRKEVVRSVILISKSNKNQLHPRNLSK